MTVYLPSWELWYGEWQPVNDSASPLIAAIGDYTVDFSGEIENAWQLFAKASAIGVMKIGDIIVTCHDCFARELPVDTLVEGTLNGVTALHFRIK